MEPVGEQPTSAEPKSNGALVGAIIIIIILIVGGIYLWQSGVKEAAAPANVSEDFGTSDNPDVLEQDLESLDLDSLDEGL